MKKTFALAALLLVIAAALWAQSPNSQSPNSPSKDAVSEMQSPSALPASPDDLTGMYSFLHEGEFVQIEVNAGKVTGLVSRFKNEDPEKGEFVDQYFDQASLHGNNLSFRTKAADGLWFEFNGTIERGPAKSPSQESYWEIHGQLTEHKIGSEGKEKSKELTLKSFPQDAAPEPPH